MTSCRLRFHFHDDGTPHLDRDSVLGGGPELCLFHAGHDGVVDRALRDALLQPGVGDAAVLVDEHQNDDFTGPWRRKDDFQDAEVR